MSVVLYDEILLDKESVEKLERLLNNAEFDTDSEFNQKFKCFNEKEALMKDMHMTIRYYGAKHSPEIDEITLKEDELGAKVELNISELGVYMKNGDIMNVGVRVDDSNFNEIYLSRESEKAEKLDKSDKSDKIRTLADVSYNKIPHVTIKVAAGVAKPVDTQKCFEVFSNSCDKDSISKDVLSVTNKNSTANSIVGESSLVLKLKEPITISGTTKAVKAN